MSKTLDIIIPCFNEEKNIQALWDELVKILKNIDDLNTSCIFIDDGSTDGTVKEIKKIQRSNKSVILIEFTRNYGHASALEAGISRSTADALISIDADLQHPPILILEMIKKWRQGYLVVSTIRETKTRINIFKKITSSAFYFVINLISDVKIHSGSSDYRLIDSRVINTLNSLPESPKFYRGLIPWLGFSEYQIKFHAQPRLSGETGYSLSKMFELARLGITSLSFKPLKLIFLTGMGLTLFSSFIFITLLMIKLIVDYDLFSMTTILLFFVLAFTGILVTLQGIVGLYMIDILRNSRRRPTYILKFNSSTKAS